jgi:uncharacterized protein
MRRRPARNLLAGAAALVLALVGLTLATASASFAADADQSGNPLPHLADHAGLLTDAQAADLESELDRISDERGVDVVVVTVPTLGFRTATEFADDYFDYGPDPLDPTIPGSDPDAGYGRGPDRSGILFLVSTEGRDGAFSTTGETIKVYTDERLEGLQQDVAGYLHQDDWNGAFQAFAINVDRTYHNATRFRWEIVALVTLGAALIGGFGPVTVWRRQLKSVRPAANARDYLETSSLVLTSQNEVLVSQNTVVVSTQTSSGGGGSSTHFGSSGRSHGGSSFKF